MNIHQLILLLQFFDNISINNILKYNYNWHLVTFGLLYIIILLGLETILLAILDNTLYQYLRDLGDLNFAPFQCPNTAQGKSRGSA